MERRFRWWPVMEGVRRCALLLLLAAYGHGIAGDLFEEMEDAFAEDSAPAETCRSGETLVICRLGYDVGASQVERLSPCLCTYLIYEDSGSNPPRPPEPGTRALLSVQLSALMQSRRTDIRELVKRVETGGFDGVDITVGREMEQPRSLAALKEFDGALRTNKSEVKLTSLTFIENYPSPSFAAQIARDLHVPIFSFFLNQTWNTSVTDSALDQILKLGIPSNKIVFGMSLQSTTPFPQKCADLLHYLHEQESPSEIYKTNNMLQNLKIQVELIQQKKVAGVDIWNLTADDDVGVCGGGPYPILQKIQDKINPKPAIFEDFADLDIILSTGESEQQPAWKRLDYTSKGTQINSVWNILEIQEEIEKLPCDRVGFYRHPSDCTRFYHCSEYRSTTHNHSGPYTGFLYKCPKGLVFDGKQESCVWPSWSEPCQGSGELLPVPTKKFTCRVPGFHVDPINCRWFYYCSDLGDGKLEAFEFLCPSDLLGFDKEKMLCNWKWTVPICISNNKAKIVQNIFPKSTHEAAVSNRSSKALKDEGIQDATVRPRILNLNSPIKETNVAIGNSTTIKNTLYSNHSEKAHIVDDLFPSLRLIDQNKNTPEKKHGTAKWRRTQVNSRTNNLRLPTVNPGREHNLSNYQEAKQNNSTFHEKDKSVNEELRRSFKGIVRKIERKIYHFPVEINEEKTNLTRKASSENQRIRVKLVERQKTDGNVLKINKVNDTVKNKQLSLEDKENAPFANVKCSKLKIGQTSKEQGEADLGCTSEVSLTIRTKPGTDSNKYILKENQIKRTAYQESQQIQYLENPKDKEIISPNKKNYFGREGRNMPEIGDNVNITLSFISNLDKNNDSLNLPSTFNQTSEVHKLDAQNTKNSEMSEKTKNSSNLHDKQEKVQSRNTISSQIDLPRNYEIKPHSMISIYGNNSLVHLAPKSQKLIKDTTNNDKISVDSAHTKPDIKTENHNHTKMIPIHFFPQGVLLNINLDQINKISPQILLEVDNMLKKYMTGENIDFNKLEKKLNASQEKMAEKDQMDSNEVMEMIKIIENAIYISGKEMKFKKVNSTYSSRKNNIDNTFSYTGTLNGFEHNTTEEKFQYESISKPLENNLTKNYILNNVSTNKMNDDDTNVSKMLLINDKIQVTDSSQTEELNVTNVRKPFGRRRLIRKFKYPTIREQLKRQNELKIVHSRISNTKESDVLRTPISFSSSLEGNQRYIENTRKVNADFFSDVVSSQLTAKPLELNNYPRVQTIRFGDRIRVESDAKLKMHNQVIQPHVVTSKEINIRNLGKVDKKVNSFKRTGNEFAKQLNPSRLNLQRNVGVIRDNLNPDKMEKNIYSHAIESGLQYTLPLKSNPNTPTYSHQFIQNTPNDNTPHLRSFSTNVEQQNFATRNQPGIKKRKLRILVRKVTDSSSVEEHRTYISNREEDGNIDRIPQNVLKTLRRNLFKKLPKDDINKLELQIHFQDQVWNIPFVNEQSETDLSPAVCTRAGLFQHPRDCTMFYECFWDKWLQRFTLHVFSCPVRLVYDQNVRGCSRSNTDSPCRSFE